MTGDGPLIWHQGHLRGIFATKCESAERDYWAALGRVEVAEFLVGWRDALVLGAELGRHDADAEVVALLLDRHPDWLDGFDPSDGGWCVPLMDAVVSGAAGVAAMLLSRGVAVEGDARHRSPLWEAAWLARSGLGLEDTYASGADSYRVIRRLLDAGADPHRAQPGGEGTPDGAFRAAHGVGLLEALTEFERRHGPG